jgi:hypothetical protein
VLDLLALDGETTATGVNLDELDFPAGIHGGDGGCGCGCGGVGSGEGSGERGASAKGTTVTVKFKIR